MPITVSQIAANLATVTFPYDSEEVTLTYYPGHVTERTFAVFNKLTGGEVTSELDLIDRFSSFNEVLVYLIKEWDVYDDQGQMFPLEPARLAELPFVFRIQVFTEIIRNIRPNQVAPQTGNSSA